MSRASWNVLWCSFKVAIKDFGRFMTLVCDYLGLEPTLVDYLTLHFGLLLKLSGGTLSW